MVLKIIPGRKGQHWWFEISRVIVRTKTVNLGTSLIDHTSASGSDPYGFAKRVREADGEEGAVTFGANA
jgi:hypothetical protein